MYLRFKYYSLSDEDKKELIGTIKDVLSKYDDVLLAIIFGSFIELSEFRDIDLAIYSLNTDIKYLTKLAMELELKIGLPIDLIPINEVSSRLKYYILTKGEVILERIPGIYEALLMMTLDELLINNLTP